MAGSPIVTLTFDDGRVEEVKMNPRVLVEIERHYDGKPPRIEGTLYGAWHKLGRQGDFNAWLDTLEDIDEREGEAANPSPPEASGDS
jgi:hypothetical protein